MYDVCIIGAGVLGANIARLLSQYQLKILLVDKESDVSCGCSKANSGIVHGGYSDEPGTLAAKFCVQGNRMYERLHSELNFGYRRTGSLVLAFSPEDIPQLEKLYQNGIANGVTGLAILSGDEVLAREPHLNPAVKAALYCENAGVTSPYEFVIALVENAIANGVELKLESRVTAIHSLNPGFSVTLNQNSSIQSRYVINAAGIYSDSISALAGITGHKITPRRGQYILLNKNQSHLISSVIFQVPTKLGKGILVTPTYHGNLMIGPNAEDIDDKDDTGTDTATLAHIVQTARLSVPDIDLRQALTSFAGNRPVGNHHGWVIEKTELPGFIHLVGVDSPGLTSSPAIAQNVRDLLQESGLKLIPNPKFNPLRPPIIHPKSTDFDGKIDDPDPKKNIICRCEQVTEAEIIDSLHRGIPVRSIPAVKLRTRAGMGQCQGAFCRSRVQRLLARELKLTPEEILVTTPPSSELAARAKRLDLLTL